MTKNRDLSEIIDEMPIASDILFSEAFDKRPDRAEFLIRDVLEYLGYTDFKIISSKTQTEKYDIFEPDKFIEIEVKLENEELLTVIVQLTHQDHLNPLQSRSVLAINDISSLNGSDDYSKLLKRILIVISEKNLTRSELPIETTRQRIMETGQFIEDDQTIVFVNHENITEENTPQNIKDLFEPDFKKVLNPRAREILKEYKESEEGRKHFRRKLNELIDKELQEQRKQEQKLIDEQIKENQKLIEELFKEKRELRELLAKSGINQTSS